MKLLAEKAKDNWNARPVTIAFLGDSVTQGCFEIYKKNETEIETVFDKNNAYHTDVAKILAVLFPSVPVNIFNAGISGDNAPHALERMEQDVLCHHPDLTTAATGSKRWSSMPGRCEGFLKSCGRRVQRSYS